MLAQVGVSRPLHLRVCDHLVDRVELVEPGEDQGLFDRPVPLQVDHVLLLDIDEAVEDPQERVRLADFLPEVGDWVLPIGPGRVTGPTVIPLVEGKEEGVLPRKLGGHPDLAVGHREMDNRAAMLRQKRMLAFRDRVYGQAVAPVLGLRVFDRLGEIRLQLDRRQRQAVQEQAEVYGELAARVIFQLRHDPQPVRRVAVQDLLVALVLRGRLGQVEVTGASDGEAPAQGLYHSLFLQRSLQPVHDHCKGLVAVHCLKSVPFLRLGGAQPGLQILRIHGSVRVIGVGRADQPACGCELLDDIGLEVLLVMQVAHSVTSVPPACACCHS